MSEVQKEVCQELAEVIEEMSLVANQLKQLSRWRWWRARKLVKQFDVLHKRAQELEAHRARLTFLETFKETA